MNPVVNHHYSVSVKICGSNYIIARLLFLQYIFSFLSAKTEIQLYVHLSLLLALISIFVGTYLFASLVQLPMHKVQILVCLRLIGKDNSS